MTDLFEEKAKDWDANEMVMALSSAIGTTMLKQVQFNSEMQVMDFGAGTGLITSQIAPYVNKISAVDVSESMLQQLLAKQELKDKVETICQDITSQPLEQRFDLIMSAMAMHHVEDTNKMIEQFAAHLKPGAGIALADLDKEDGSFHPPEIEGVFHFGFERKQLQLILEKHGFVDVNFVTAHTVDKELKTYPVFLVTATKI
ncbi:MAG: class I SAM-dependent methyltransferase [Gammaproteobacteria bacterium]|nr:class I SAM-dependent methyltransferase [Gammaproteobacteria bacterium]MDH5729347.1 class I SAM-dependent methyltransferase [Gammaproteobacteria bacterium]